MNAKFSQMTESEQNIQMFSKYAVGGCGSVKEFLDRYYRQERYKGRGDEYAKSLLSSYEERFARLGICSISHHDSVTAKDIFMVQNIGSDSYRVMLVVNDGKGGLFVNAGCFWGTEKEFLEAVKRKHGTTTTGKQYRMMLKLAKERIHG